MIQTVKRNIKNTGLCERGAAVIVGLSGGPDSTALTYILHGLQYELGFHLHIAHYNHHLHRNASADQKFVEHLSEQLNVPCTIGHWRKSQQPATGSLEDAARQKRFQFFARLAKRIDARCVILAHTENDLAETVLMRILRGTGLQGLRGILPVTKIEGVSIIRPMLSITKKDVMSFLEKRKIVCREDPTNRQKKFLRNKVRLELLPLLRRQYNRNIQYLLTNLAINVSTDYDYIDEQSGKLFMKIAQCSPQRKWIRLDLESLNKQHPALKRMLIRNCIRHLKGDTHRLTLKHFLEIEHMLESRPNRTIVSLPKNISIRKNSRQLIFTLK